MSEWKTVSLSDVAEIRVSNVDKKTVSSEKTVRLCNYMDVYTGNYLIDTGKYMEATATQREISNYSLQRGDILITKDSESPDDIGIPAIIDEDVTGLVCGYHLAILRPKPGVLEPVYLFQQLQTERLRAYFAQRAAGSTRYGLSLGAIAAAPILLAPDRDQREIGAALRALDTQIEQTEGLVAKQEQLRAGLIDDLFKRGIDETGRLRAPRQDAPHLYAETAFGWFPTAWSVLPLERCAHSLIDGPFGSNLKTQHYVEEPGVRVVRLQNIQSGFYNDSDRMYVSEAHARRLARFDVLSGDVLIASLGDETYEVGRACVYPVDFPPAINKADCFRLRPNTRMVTAIFIAHSLNSAALRLQKARVSQGVTRERMNLGNCRRLMIPIAPLPEQHLIGDAIQAADLTLDQTRAAIAKLHHIKAGLLHRLLDGAAIQAGVADRAA